MEGKTGTRTRRSGRLNSQPQQGASNIIARPLKRSAKTDNAEESYGESGESEEDNGKGRGKGKGKGKEKTVAKPPPKKRAKPTARKAGKAHEIDGKLSLLPTLPLDILFEIWRHLPSQTLLALTQVNRLFRETILSEGCLFVWVAAREAHEVPEPLPGFSEYHWARMLSSEKCQICRTRKAYAIFHWGKRLCSTCIKTCAITKPKFKSRFPNQDSIALDLIKPKWSGTTWLYSIEDIEGVLEALKACKNEKERENYINERKAYLVEIEQKVKDCVNWRLKIRNKNYQDRKDNRQSRHDQIKAKLMELGYTERDVECSGYKSLPSGIRDTPLTDKGWNMIKNDVVTTLKMSRVCRAFSHDTEGVLLSRREMLSNAYTAYKKTVTPINSRDLPNIPTLMLNTSLMEIFSSPDEPALSQEQVTQAFMQIVPHLTTMFAPTKTLLLEELQQGSALTWRGGSQYYFKPENTKGIRGPLPPPTTTSFELAIVQLACSQCRSIIPTLTAAFHHMNCPLCCFSARSFDTVYLHKMRQRGLDTLSLADATRAVVSMLEASGMDTDTTTADQMDQKGDVYECVGCEQHNLQVLQNHQGQQNHHGLHNLPGPHNPQNVFRGTWRECNKHFNRTHWLTRPDEYLPMTTSPFRLVTSQNHQDERECWSCAHCLAHIEGKTVNRATVVAHVGSEHGVQNPRVPDDFFYNSHECEQDQRRMYRLGQGFLDGEVAYLPSSL
ncbi:hypothetical protein V5O48_002977 [Marasmius crinis-equi]|uniref:F-box domain-containing protein n=1 Tax=Marasmius crinis-equi TaxID=585013 RepID=A0ABR3FU53_9AGAR